MDPETEGLTLGIHRYRKRLQKLRESELESCTSAVQRVLVNSVENMTKAMQSWMSSAKSSAGRLHSVVPLLESMDPALVSLHTSRVILDGISTARTINSLSMSVGRFLEDEMKFLHARRNNKGWWRKYSKLAMKMPVEGGRSKFLKRVAKEAHLHLPGWTPKQRCSVGLVCIELFRQANGIVEVSTDHSLMKSVTYVRATDEFLEWLKKSHDASEVLHPVFLPMISKPLEWTSIWLGGYRGPEMGRRPLLKTRNRTYLKAVSDLEMPAVFSAVNRVQNTPFCVNHRVLEVLKHCWEKDLQVGELPRREPVPIPDRPEGADTETRRSWWKNASRIKFENECERSKQIAVTKTIWTADKFKDSAVYFPQELDFRGRVYPTSNFLNVQGPDYAKALLTFKKEQPIDDDGMSWLAIHGANCWGHDKEPYSERLKVIQDNHGLIMAIGKDPLANMDWTKADKPFNFLAFCIEWWNIHQGVAKTRLPVHLDGSNNGLQIFSLLLRDPVGGLATNCLPTETPRDIYSDVSDRLVEKLLNSSNPHARVWLEIGVDRKATKRVVMCMPYGLTKFSSHEYVRDWYLSAVQAKYPAGHHPFPVTVVFDAIRFLTELLWESIDEVVHAARECMDWLKEIARIHVENGHPIRWTAPNGLMIQQAYCKSSRVAVKTSVGSVLRQHRILSDGTDLSIPRNVNGISPNFVHSLDAAVLMAAVNLGAHNGIDCFSCIHDSIGVNAQHAGIMSATIREVSVEIFSTPVLDGVVSEMRALTGLDLPDPPPSGTMDINLLRDADYFFA
jgi:DNA-directed RNA polymerase